MTARRASPRQDLTPEAARRDARREPGLEVQALDKGIFDLDDTPHPGSRRQARPPPLRGPFPRPGDGGPVPDERGIPGARLSAGGQGRGVHERRVRH